MRQDLLSSTAARSYATAHNAHYGSKNLRQALGLYEDIMAAHPDSIEAGYSRAQIHNIARTVVPNGELLAAEAALARSRLANAEAKEGAKSPAEEGEQLEAL